MFFRQTGLIVSFYILIENIDSDIFWKQIDSVVSFTMIFFGLIGLQCYEYRYIKKHYNSSK